MRQYFDAKRQHRDAIVFFRMGDFYEMFYEDALTAARALELTLTSRSKDASGGAIPMCGVPSSRRRQLHRPARASKGFASQICEQVEDPRKAKGLVRREVVRVVSPGTLTDAGYLELASRRCWSRSAPATDAHGLGVALLDLSTGEFTTAEYPGADGAPGACRRADDPSAAGDAAAGSRHDAGAPPCGAPTLQARVTSVDAWAFELEAARRALVEQLQDPRPGRLRSRDAPVGGPRGRRAGALSARARRRRTSRTCATIAFRAGADCLLDRSDDAAESRGDRSARRRDATGSLLDEIDRTVTPMGGRHAPGVAVAAARVARADSGSPRRRRGVRVPDDRARASCATRSRRSTTSSGWSARAALGTAGPRDLVSLRQSLAAVPRVRAAARAICRRRSSGA